jgi:hypothetical protein
MDCFKNFVTKYINEATTKEELGFDDKDSANVFYYIGRYIENKGPQTSAAIEKYLESKFNGNIPAVNIQEKAPLNWATFLGRYFYKDGRKWDFTADTHDWWDEVAKWHEANAESEDPNAKYVKQFFDWYNDKKKGNETNPPKDLIKFVNSTAAEDVEKAFGKYYKFAMGQLDKYLDWDFLNDEDKLIQKFWDWHRAKKAGKPYQLDQDTIDGLVTFLRKPKAVEVLQQYYYYFVRVIEKLSDKNIKTPINTTGLQKELQRIMDNLENDDFVDELERIERNRLRGGDMTAGPVFVLPTEVIKSIRTLAKDTNNINKEKVGKIDKSQVKDCYVYCVNELNRKFHVGKTGIFDLNIQDFYDTYKIVFQRGFNTKTLHKIFDEVSQYLLDQLDKGTADYWKNRGKIEQDEIDDFNEAYKLLTANGYTILEDTEDDVLAHGPSAFDIGRMNQGKKPSWAKKITEIGPRPPRPKRSQDWTERAMDSVRGIKKPYTESDWRKDMEMNKKMYTDLAEKLKHLINFDYRKMEPTKDELSIYVGKNLEFRITAEGLSYFVKRINFDSVLDRKSYRAKSMKDLIEWIEGQI